MAATIVTADYRSGQLIYAGTSYAVITAAETNDIKSGSGKVAAVAIWGDDSGTTCTVDVYDNYGASSGKVWRWDSANTATPPGVYALQMPMGTGIRVVVGGTLPTNGGVTVIFA